MADKELKSLNFGGEDTYFPLPLVTSEDNDKILAVIDGEWGVSTPEEMGYISQEQANTQLEEANASWSGDLTFSGTYATATYYTAAGCSLAVDKQKGMAFITIQSGTSSSYENIYFTGHTLPDGVTALTTQKYGGPTTGTAGAYFTQVLTGITGKVNVAVALSTYNSTYDYVQANLTVTYV